MKFIVTDGTDVVKTWDGIMPYRNLNDLAKHPDAVLVVAWFDGEPDFWLVERFESLVELYEADWGPGRVTFQKFVRS